MNISHYAVTISVFFNFYPRSSWRIDNPTCSPRRHHFSQDSRCKPANSHAVTTICRTTYGFEESEKSFIWMQPVIWKVTFELPMPFRRERSFRHSTRFMTPVRTGATRACYDIPEYRVMYFIFTNINNSNTKVKNCRSRSQDRLCWLRRQGRNISKPQCWQKETFLYGSYHIPGGGTPCYLV